MKTPESGLSKVRSLTLFRRDLRRGRSTHCWYEGLAGTSGTHVGKPHRRSELNLLRQRQGVIDFDPEVTDRTLDLRMPEQNLHSAQVKVEDAVDGDIDARDCLLRFRRKGRTLAVASIFRDIQSLEAEISMEAG